MPITDWTVVAWKPREMGRKGLGGWLLGRADRVVMRFVDGRGCLRWERGARGVAGLVSDMRRARCAVLDIVRVRSTRHPFFDTLSYLYTSLYPPSTDNPIVFRSARPHESVLISSQIHCTFTLSPLRYRSDSVPSKNFPPSTSRLSPLTKTCSLTHQGWSSNVQQLLQSMNVLHLMSHH
jgi:hypothetical protein